MSQDIPVRLINVGQVMSLCDDKMKWALTLHGGEKHGETIIISADSADEARRMAVREMKRNDARVFELEKLE